MMHFPIWKVQNCIVHGVAKSQTQLNSFHSLTHMRTFNIKYFYNMSLFYSFILAACGILVPQPGIEPVPLHWEHGVLTTGPAQKSIPQWY